MTSRAVVLYASYVSPFPSNSGERIRAVNLISALRWLDYEVEAIVGNYDSVDLAAHGRDGVRYHAIPFAWPRLRQAAGVYFRPQIDFVRQVTALHQSRPLKAIMLDYGFLGAQIASLKRLGIPIVLGTHNVESTLTGLAPQASTAGGLAIRLRQAIEFAHERLFFRLADAVICVSEEDRRIDERFVPAERLHIVPNFIDVRDDYGGSLRENRIMMSGSFGNFQNTDGLRWFMQEVWDEELSRQTRLCVAGNLSDRAVQEFARQPGVVGLGPRDDLLGEIARSRCAVVPLRHGSGTRFKCLEAMAVRTPIVATSKGCEGIEHSGAFRVADTAPAFKSALLKLLGDPDEARKSADLARAVYDRRYGLAANARRLDRAIEGAARSSAE